MPQNYAESLFSFFSQVANQSQTGRKIIEEVMNLFEERANLEEKYAKSLEQLGADIAKLDEKQQIYKVPIFCLKVLQLADNNRLRVYTLKQEKIQLSNLNK